MFLWCFAADDVEMQYLCLPFAAGLLAHTHSCSAPDRQVPPCTTLGSWQTPHIRTGPWGWSSLRGGRGCPLLAMPCHQLALTQGTQPSKTPTACLCAVLEYRRLVAARRWRSGPPEISYLSWLYPSGSTFNVYQYDMFWGCLSEVVCKKFKSSGFVV